MEVAMGAMMGAMGGWVLLWALLGLVLVVGGGVLAARVLATRHNAEPPQIRASDSPAVREAKDALRQRYANGEISREEYLQAKVELED
jgi:putative membrane protein